MSYDGDGRDEWLMVAFAALIVAIAVSGIFGGVR